MSKKVKVLISVVAAILLLTIGATVPVMAEEESTPAPEAGANGLLARVAEILDIPQDGLVNAFKQAQQEMREEACIRSLDKAVEKGCITQGEADELKEWWEQRPEVMGSGPFGRALGSQTLRRGHMGGGFGECHRLGPPELAE